MAGSVELQTTGHKIIASFERQRITLQFPDLASLFAARSAKQTASLLGKMLGLLGAELWASVGSRRSVMLYPNPKLWLRALVPEVRVLRKSGRRSTRDPLA